MTIHPQYSGIIAQSFKIVHIFSEIKLCKTRANPPDFQSDGFFEICALMCQHSAAAAAVGVVVAAAAAIIAVAVAGAAAVAAAAAKEKDKNDNP